MHVPNFGGGGGCQGRRTRVGLTTVTNSLILAGWVTKVYRIPKKIGEWKGGWQQYFDFSYITCSTKNATLKKMHFGQFFLFVFVKFRNL